MFDLKKLDGLKRYNTNGYYQYYIPDHHLANKAGLVYEHQIMAKEKLGRELKPEEVVHHNDRDRHNNSFDNLMIFKTSADHAAYHGGRNIILEGDVYVAIGKYQRKEYSRDGVHYVPIKNKCPYCGKLKYSQANIIAKLRQQKLLKRPLRTTRRLLK